MLPHAEEPRQVLELDGARLLAVAAGGACPQRLLAHDVRHEGRQLALAAHDRPALRQQVMLDAVVHPLLRQRLAGEERGAGVLAAAAFRAGEGVEALLPREVARRGGADLHRVGVGVVGVQRRQVDRRHGVGRSPAMEVQRRQRGDDVEMLADRQQDEEGEHHEHLHPVARDVAGMQCGRRPARHGVGHDAAREGERTLAGDVRIGGGEQREAEAVEREVGDHDREDQRQDGDRLAIGLEPRRALAEAAPVRIGERQQHGDLHHVLGGGEEVARRPRIGKRLVVADDDELDLAHQQRHEAEEDRRMHDPRLPVAQHHSPLQEAIDQDRAQPPERMVEPVVRREPHDDGELAPREPAEAGERRQHQERERDRAHAASVSVRARAKFAFAQKTHGTAQYTGATCRPCPADTREEP